jgi:anaerobic selenocysteine-containing dehydrogenase
MNVEVRVADKEEKKSEPSSCPLIPSTGTSKQMTSFPSGLVGGQAMIRHKAHMAMGSSPADMAPSAAWWIWLVFGATRSCSLSRVALGRCLYVRQRGKRGRVV